MERRCKMRKVFSALLGGLSIGVAVFALWLCTYADRAEVKPDIDPAESGETLTHFFDCLRSEQWDEAYACLYDAPSLGLESAPADALSGRFWAAQKQVLDFRLSGEWTLDGLDLRRQVTVRGLDMDAIRDDVAASVQTLLAEAVEAARLKNEVYDADGSYREDVAMAALDRAVEDNNELTT